MALGLPLARGGHARPSPALSTTFRCKSGMADEPLHSIQFDAVSIAMTSLGDKLRDYAKGMTRAKPLSTPPYRICNPMTCSVLAKVLYAGHGSRQQDTKIMAGNLQFRPESLHPLEQRCHVHPVRIRKSFAPGQGSHLTRISRAIDEDSRLEPSNACAYLASAARVTKIRNTQGPSGPHFHDHRSQRQPSIPSSCKPPRASLAAFISDGASCDCNQNISTHA